MRVAAIVLCLAMTPLPAAAQTGFSRDVNGWKVSGAGGNCTARLGAGTTSLLLLSPDPKGKDHGVLGLRDDSWTFTDGPTTVELAGTGPWARPWRASASAKTKTYWLPLHSPEELDAFPDNFVMDAKEGGRQFPKFFVTGFKAAIAANRECARVTGGGAGG